MTWHLNINIAPSKEKRKRKKITVPVRYFFLAPTPNEMVLDQKCFASCWIHCYETHYILSFFKWLYLQLNCFKIPPFKKIRMARLLPPPSLPRYVSSSKFLNFALLNIFSCLYLVYSCADSLLLKFVYFSSLIYIIYLLACITFMLYLQGVGIM